MQRQTTDDENHKNALHNNRAYIYGLFYSSSDIKQAN